MNPISLISAIIITFALFSYGIGSITLQRFKMVSPGVLLFLSLGLILNIVATRFMIIGASAAPLRLHDLLGYSALLTMLIDVFLIWRWVVKKKINAIANKHLLTYSKFAYGWWVLAYLTGSLLIIW